MARRTVNDVRKVANALEISEATVWRWLKAVRKASYPDPVEPLALLDLDRYCAACGAKLPPLHTVTRRLTYCDGTCRQAAHRRRVETRRRAAFRDRHPSPSS